MLWQGWGATGVGGSDLANVNIGFRSTCFFAGIKTLTGSPLGKLYDFQQESKFSLLHVEEPPAFCESTPDSTNSVSQVFAIKTLKSSFRFLSVESPESLRFFSFVYPSIIQE